MRTILRFSMGFACATLMARAASAQVTVQQPVVDRFSVGTTVSVPDRGRAYLGGVKSAGDSRAQYGFGPLRGSNVGQFRSASSSSVSVFIHDFDEMDRQLLGQGRSGGAALPSVDGYRDLMARNQRRGTSLGAPAGAMASVRESGRTHPPTNASEAVDDVPEAPSLPPGQAERSFQLAQQAEQRGAMAVAKLHYRMASRHGHPDADERLAALDEPSGITAKPERSAGRKGVPSDARR
jgi:hypothetical protein